MPEPAEAIRLLVAPVVMISACGLLCLALYNRLAVIVARARAFNKERVECAEEQREEGGDAPHLARRIATLDGQFEGLLRRAKLVRAALAALLCTVASMLVCSLALGLMIVAPFAGEVALAVFVVGVSTALVAIVYAMLELRLALDPVAVEEMSLHEGPGGHAQM